MKPNKTDNTATKHEAKYQDPFLDAIARNPRPLSMVLIGIIGMPLVLWLSAPSRDASEGRATPPSYESTTPQPLQRARTEQTIAVDAPDTAEVDLDAAVPTPAETPLPASTRPSITLIIDDIGYNAALGERAIALPGDITYAVLPHTPNGKQLAELAHQRGKEIMLHAPMSNQANMELGPGALTSELSKEEFTRTLSAAIDAVPYLQGVNNHMGSALTEQEIPMLWVMETLKQKGLYFVDSYTTAQSVAGRVAKENAIPTITRNVFLDNIQEHEAIDTEFKKLVAQARNKGLAVGIGHPYAATIDYLEVALPLLEQQGIDLVFASKMIALQKKRAHKRIVMPRSAM